MDTNALLRQRVWRFVRLGVNQKVLASRMGLSESSFSRWLRRKSAKGIAVTALDGFNQFVVDIQREAHLDLSKLTDDEREQIQSETAGFETEHEIRRAERADKRSRTRRRAGRKVAKKS